MTSSTHHHIGCISCAFAPFCTATDKKLPQRKQLTAAVSRHRALKRNEFLYLPKNKFQHLYVIQRGALKTYQMEADGKELIRGFYFAGEILGYEAISTGHYPFSAVALLDTVVCEVPYDNILELLHGRPALQKRMLYLISQQLNAGAYLALTTAEQRLAAFLLDVSARLAAFNNETEFHLPISRQDIGNHLRLTAETVSRLFSRLQKSKVIATQHKKIHFLQPQKLKQLAEGVEK
jgi:CRP/FNR family transcriptional regulator, anaerobic regulatory protein